MDSTYVRTSLVDMWVEAIRANPETREETLAPLESWLREAVVAQLDAADDSHVPQGRQSSRHDQS